MTGLTPTDCLDLVRLVDKALDISTVIQRGQADLNRYMELRDSLFEQYDINKETS